MNSVADYSSPGIAPRTGVYSGGRPMKPKARGGAKTVPRDKPKTKRLGLLAGLKRS